MNFRVLANKISPAVRSIHTSTAVRSGHDTRGIVGSNVPFPTDNKYLFIGIFTVYCASGIGLPFLSLRSMCLAKNQG